MEAFSSRFRGVGFEEVHAGFEDHRRFNLARKTSQSFKGETRYLNNRAIFATRKAPEVPQEVRTSFVDHKVWSA